jgi:hypothetical protein
MMATSDVTALTEMSRAARIGTLKGICGSELVSDAPAPPDRPRAMKKTTGMTSVPMTPIGSLRKTFVSTQERRCVPRGIETQDRDRSAIRSP